MILHAECEKDGEELFTFSGHIHPGIKFNGSGKQSFMLPCFYFTRNICCIASFQPFYRVV